MKDKNGMKYRIALFVFGVLLTSVSHAALNPIQDVTATPGYDIGIFLPN